MEKPIIATNLDGLLIEPSAFYKPHEKWFERVIEKTGDKTLKKWIGADPYFPGVHIAMEKMMPKATPEQRIAQARKWYQEDVIRYIQEHPEAIKRKNARILKVLRNKFKLILITTNTKDYIDRIIEVSNLQGIYDDIIASETEREPDKGKLIDELMRKYPKPKYYLTGKSDEKIASKFKELRVKVIEEKNLNSLTSL